MKNKSILIFLLSFHFSCFAQNIDNGVLKCTYNFTFHYDSTNSSLIGKDLMVLEIGKKTSLFYSELRRVGDSLMYDDEKKGNTSLTWQSGVKYNGNSWSIILAKNFPSGEMTASETLLQPYKYTEALSPQEWAITSDTTTILDLPCSKATTTYRGRSYEAWFTKKIPTVHGPWKFYGLPGLIVKVNDTKSQFSFELQSIEKMDMLSSIVYPSKKYVKTTRKNLWDLKAQMFDDPVTFMENNSPYHLKFPDTPAERKARKRPYNPLELN